MKSAREVLADIATLPLSGEFRLLSFCGDQERVIAMSEMRSMLPPQVQLISGPGCPASVCPEGDIFQAIRIAEQHDVTLLTTENLMRLPVQRSDGGPTSLEQVLQAGADIRVIEFPVQAFVAAASEPARQMVCFLAGFETLLAPLAGMILEGVPANLVLLLSGRRADPLVARLLEQQDLPIDGLILPGNRCSLTGTGDWESLVQRNNVPAAVAGYTVSGVLAAVFAVLRQVCDGTARVDNCYRPLVTPGGNPLARDHLFRVFDAGRGQWRGIGEIADSAFSLRHAYAPVNADKRYPDYRGEMPDGRTDMPKGCDCGSVMTGQKGPSDCGLFAIRCTPLLPVGPCMASEDGPCFLQRNSRNVA